MRHVRETVEQTIGELAPAEFAQEGERAAIELSAACGGMGHGVPDLVRTDLAEMEIRRKPRRHLAVEIAPVVGVTLQALGDEVPKPRLRRALARLPSRAQTAGPIGFGREQLKALQTLALGVGETAELRGRERRAGRRRGEACLPERGEHAKGLPAPGCDRLWLEQEAAGKEPKLSVARGANRGDGFFELALPRLVAFRRMNGGSAGFIEQLRQNFRRSALTQVKPAAALGKIAVERGKAPMQPPARGAAHAQISRRRVVENVDWEQGRAGLGRLSS